MERWLGEEAAAGAEKKKAWQCGKRMWLNGNARKAATTSGTGP